MQRIGASKVAASSGKLGASFRAEFGYLPEYSRRLEYDQMPDYAGQAVYLNKRVGGKDAEGPFDWRYPSPRSITVLRLLTMKMTLKVTMRVMSAMKRRTSQIVTSTGKLLIGIYKGVQD